MNAKRSDILGKLMHGRKMTFNELWGNEGESNKFAYHLKVLEEDGFVKKTKDTYCLTHEGKKYCAYIEGGTGKKSEFPLIGVIVVIRDEKTGKVLMSRRTKEPFYGYCGFIGGKMKFSQYIYEAAEAEVFEETGLTCDFELKGIFSSKTYNNESLSYSHQMFILLGKNHKGELIEKTREGENCWASEEEISKMKTFPNVPYSIKMIKGEGFKWIEMDRFQKDDEFIGKKILKDESF
jgi:8-oxo-dGTP pyrophosphatase MutT (NUDIX family)